MESIIKNKKKKKLLGPKILPLLKKIEKILGPAFLSSSSQKAPIPAKNRLIYSVFSLLQTFKCLLGHNCTPGNVLLMRTCPPPSPARSCCIWTCPSIPAIPAPGAVWPTTRPKGHPSGWVLHPLTAHHHLPSPSGTLCMHTHVGSDSARISPFGHVHQPLPAILQDHSTT